MNAYDEHQIARLAALLAQRESELRAELMAAGKARSAQADVHGAHEVMDFKDAASDEALALVDDLQASHAAQELQQALAARMRLKNGEYGHCHSCGEAIGFSRLLALPSAALCMHCQTQQELQ